MTKKMEIDYETADKITVLNLTDSYNCLVEELRKHEEEGAWLHPEDAMRSRGLYIPALKTVIEYFGGKV